MWEQLAFIPLLFLAWLVWQTLRPNHKERQARSRVPRNPKPSVEQYMIEVCDLKKQLEEKSIKIQSLNNELNEKALTLNSIEEDLQRHRNFVQEVKEKDSQVLEDLHNQLRQKSHTIQTLEESLHQHTLQAPQTVPNEHLKTIDDLNQVVAGHLQIIGDNENKLKLQLHEIQKLEMEVTGQSLHIEDLETERRQQIQCIQELREDLEQKSSMLQGMDHKKSRAQLQQDHVDSPDSKLESITADGLVNKLKGQSTTIQDYEEELYERLHCIQELEREIREQGQTIQTLEGEVDLKDQTIQDQEEQLQGKETLLQKYEAELRLLEKEMESRNMEVGKSSNGQVDISEELHDRVMTERNTINELQEALDEHRHSISELKEELNQRSVLILEFDEQVENKRHIIKGLEQELSKQYVTLRETTAERDHLAQDIEGLRKQCPSITQPQSANSDQLETELKNHHIMLREVTADRDQLAQDIEVLRVQLEQELNKQHEDLKGVTTDRDRLARDLEVLGEQLKQELNEQHADLKEVTADRDQLVQDVELLREQLKQELNEQHAYLKEATADRDHLARDVDILTEQLEQEINKQHDVLKEVTADRDQLAQDVEVLREQLEFSQSKNKPQSDKDDQNQLIGALQEKEQIYINSIDQLEKKNANLMNDVHVLNKEMAKLNRELEKLLKEKEEHEQNVKMERRRQMLELHNKGKLPQPDDKQQLQEAILVPVDDTTETSIANASRMDQQDQQTVYSPLEEALTEQKPRVPIADASIVYKQFKSDEMTQNSRMQILDRIEELKRSISKQELPECEPADEKSDRLEDEHSMTNGKDDLIQFTRELHYPHLEAFQDVQVLSNHPQMIPSVTERDGLMDNSLGKKKEGWMFVPKVKNSQHLRWDRLYMVVSDQTITFYKSFVGTQATNPLFTIQMNKLYHVRTITHSKSINANASEYSKMFQLVYAEEDDVTVSQNGSDIHNFREVSFHIPIDCIVCSQPLGHKFKNIPALECSRCYLKIHKEHAGETLVPCKDLSSMYELILMAKSVEDRDDWVCHMLLRINSTMTKFWKTIVPDDDENSSTLSNHTFRKRNITKLSEKKPKQPGKEKKKSVTPSQHIHTNKEERNSFDDITKYPVELLRHSSKELIPDDVDPAHRERHLSRKQFAEIFKMEPEQFELLPVWKQTILRKQYDLF